jgi:IS5 family transposase
VLEGNPVDGQHVDRSLKRHDKVFGRVPELYAADRGFFSERNLTLCMRRGVELACIPQAGGKRDAIRQADEKAPAFKQGQRFRAGIEGRISVLFRGRGMKRCLAEGRERFELLVGAAVLANNLMSIASWLIKRTSCSRRHRAQPDKPALSSRSRAIGPSALARSSPNPSQPQAAATKSLPKTTANSHPSTKTPFQNRN